SGDKVSILVVDDRADKLLAYEVMLAELKQKIVCVRSGKEALRRLLREDFAAILLDVNMPGMDGFETAALIRQRQRCETTPIIFVSALNDTVNNISRILARSGRLHSHAGCSGHLKGKDCGLC